MNPAPTEERRAGLPKSIGLGLEIRRALLDTLSIQTAEEDQEGLSKATEREWPDPPEGIATLDDFFTKVDEEVTSRWAREGEREGNNSEKQMTISASAVLRNAIEEQLTEKAKERYPNVVKLLSDNEDLDRWINHQGLSSLEAVRSALPSLWQTLEIASSEIQLAKVGLARRWLKRMPESFFSSIGISHTELGLFMDIAAMVGKFINHAYIKQDDLDKTLQKAKAAKNEGEDGGVEEENGEREPKWGDKYIYAIPKVGKTGGEEIPVSFFEIFQFELERFGRDILSLANRAEKLLANGVLPEKYRSFPAYLHQLADVYTTKEKDREALSEKWLNLYKLNGELLESGCPLAILPQEDKAFDVVGFEVRLGLVLPESTYDTSPQIDSFTDTAHEIAMGIYVSSPASLSEEPKKSTAVSIDQIYAFGANLTNTTEAESYHRQVFVHTNEIVESANNTEIPLLRGVGIQINDEREYRKEAILETARHEIAHGILPAEDALISARVGHSDEGDIVEELKAETVGMVMAKNSRETMIDDDTLNIVMAKLGTVLEYLEDFPAGYRRGSEDESYYLCGVKIVADLFTSGALEIKEGRLYILDAKRAMDSIASTGNEILAMYSSPQTTPEDIQLYVDAVRHLKSQPGLKELLLVLHTRKNENKVTQERQER